MRSFMPRLQKLRLLCPAAAAERSFAERSGADGGREGGGGGGGRQKQPYAGWDSSRMASPPTLIWQKREREREVPSVVVFRPARGAGTLFYCWCYWIKWFWFFFLIKSFRLKFALMKRSPRVVIWFYLLLFVGVRAGVSTSFGFSWHHWRLITRILFK